ncbi:MAG: hypothetical protein QOE11_2918 [Solirubrobacteraceae bacterium]|jgi:hypothetical protein|nr:hypothetical protein [Solirubrobacteraceae bacterium]
MDQRPDAAAGDDEPVTLQDRLEDAGEDAADEIGSPWVPEPTIADPAALLHHLHLSGHFHRDSRLGRLYHPGMVSLREDVPTDSLHVSVDDNRVTAHIDEVSPLAVGAEGSRYSAQRTLAHNLSGMTRDLVLMLRGRAGDHRCELDCEWVADPANAEAPEPGLLDPATSAWSVQLETRVTGSLDPQRLRTALEAAVGRRTLAPEALEVVECDDDAALGAARARLHSAGVPLSSFPPLRACLARHPEGDVLMLNLNHAAADVFGALHVVNRIAAAYANPQDPGRPLDFLAARELPVRPASHAAPVVVRSHRATMARLRDRLAPFTRVAADGAVDDPGYGFHLVGLTAEETRHLIDPRRSAAHGEVFLAALHLAVGDWNRRHGMPDRRIGVLVPADLRPDEWPAQTIGNFSVNTRISTGRRSRGGPAAVLKAIATQAARSRRTRTGIALIAALERAGMLALWAKQSRVVLAPLTANAQVDSAMLCVVDSAGVVPQFGPDAGPVSELSFTTPSRAPLCLCIGVTTVEGRLQLALRYPYRLFDRAGVSAFSDCYLAHVRRVAGALS